MMKTILICVLVICFEIVELIPYNNEEWARQKAYRTSYRPVNQNLPRQYQSTSFTRPQTVTPSSYVFEENDNQRNIQQRRNYKKYKLHHEYKIPMENKLPPVTAPRQRTFKNQYIKSVATSADSENEHRFRSSVTEPYRDFQSPYQWRNNRYSPPFRHRARLQQPLVENTKWPRGTFKIENIKHGLQASSQAPPLHPKQKEYNISQIESPQRYDQHIISNPRVNDYLASQKRLYLPPSGVDDRMVYVNILKSIIKNNTINLDKAEDETKSGSENLKITKKSQIPVATHNYNPMQITKPLIKRRKVYPESITEKIIVLQPVVNPFIKLHKPDTLIVHSTVKKNSTAQDHNTSELKNVTASSLLVNSLNITQYTNDTIISPSIKPANEVFIIISPIKLHSKKVNNTSPVPHKPSYNYSQPIDRKSGVAQGDNIVEYIQDDTKTIPLQNIGRKLDKESSVFYKNNTNDDTLLDVPIHKNFTKVFEDTSQPMSYIENDVGTEPEQSSNDIQPNLFNTVKNNGSPSIFPINFTNMKTSGNSVFPPTPQIKKYTDIVGVISLPDEVNFNPKQSSENEFLTQPDKIKNNDIYTPVPAKQPTENYAENITRPTNFTNTTYYISPSTKVETQAVSPVDDTIKRTDNGSSYYSKDPKIKRIIRSKDVSDPLQTSILSYSTSPAEVESKIVNDTTVNPIPPIDSTDQILKFTQSSVDDYTTESPLEIVKQKVVPESTKLDEMHKEIRENLSDAQLVYDNIVTTPLQNDTKVSNYPTEKNGNNEEPPTKASARTFKNTVISEVDFSDLKSTDEPIVLLRPKEDFWNTLSSDNENVDVVYYFIPVHKSPIVEKDTKSTAYPNGTIVQELIETLKEHDEDPEPKAMKIVKVINPGDAVP